MADWNIGIVTAPSIRGSGVPACTAFVSIRLYCFIAFDPAIFHHKQNPLEHSDVIERISRYGDDIGKEASFEFPDLSSPSQQLRTVEQISLKHRHRPHAVLHHQLQFPRLGTVRK